MEIFRDVFKEMLTFACRTGVKLKFDEFVRPTENLEVTKTPLGRIDTALSEEKSPRRQNREHEWNIEDDW